MVVSHCNSMILAMPRSLSSRFLLRGFALMRTTNVFLLLVLAALFASPSARSTQCTVQDPSLRGSYVGECVSGVASGKGVAVGKNRYEGSFRDGWPSGAGVYTKSDGARFEGEFVGGKPHGRVTVYQPNGSTLEGTFREARLDGVGKATDSSGKVTAVELRDGKLVLVGSQASLSPSAPPSPPPLPSPSPLTPPAPPTPALSPVRWSPLVRLDDIYPAYALVNAARTPRGKPPRGFRGDPWGQVGFSVKTVTANSRVVVRVAIDQFAQPSEEQFLLEEPGDYVLYAKVRYDFATLRSTVQPTPVNVSWSMSVNGQSAGTQTKTVRMRSVNDAPYAVADDRGVTDLNYVFVGYVNEDFPGIDVLLKETIKNGHVREFVGYQRGPEWVDRQVEAIYNTLRRKGIRYSSITTTSGASSRVQSQHVRFLSDSVNAGQANCIDGTVLFASILRKIGIDSYVLLGPGHAIVGYSQSGNKRDGISAIETVMLGTDSFNAARRQGDAQLSEWSRKRDPQFHAISVADARNAGIAPIGR